MIRTIAVAVCCAALAACSPEPSAPPADTEPVRRVVTFAPHLAEIMFEVGAGDKLVGVSAWSDFPRAVLELPEVGDAFTVEFRSPEKRGVTRELIDHVLVTPALRDERFWLRLPPGRARVEHAISRAHTRGSGLRADDRPSDHFPVTAEFDLD